MTNPPQYPEYPGDDAERRPPAYGQEPPAYGQQPPPPAYGQQPPPSYGQQPPPAYGQQPPPAYGQAPGYGYTPSPPQNQKAIWGMVLGIVSILFCYLGVLIGPAAIILSVMAGREIDAARPGAASGKGMATAGLVTGIIGTVIWGSIIALTIIGLSIEE